MSISGLPSVSTVQAIDASRTAERTSTSNGPGFAERLGSAISQVAENQNSAAQHAQSYVAGETNNLAAVMVEQQVASLGFQMTLQVRNKALSAYRDIMNMPV